MHSPIIISGLGVVSAAGGNAAVTLESFDTGIPEPAPTTLFETQLECPVFEVTSFKSSGFHNLTSRTAGLTCQAVQEALKDAANPQENPELNIGVCLGTTVASQLNNLEFYTQYRENRSPKLQPVKDFLNGNLANTIARIFALKGPQTTVVNACSSGADAIGTAMCWLQAGLCDMVVTGGADELNRIPLCGFHSLGIMSERPCKPFDRNRDGLNLGEGAGILVLETEESARCRGVNFDVALSGYGSACDSHHLTAPHPEGVGLKIAIQTALRFSGMQAEDIAFINAHGTATPDNDRVEGKVISEIFGTSACYFSTKGITGHTLGAAGGIEAAFTALSLRKKWIPGCVGCSIPDPDLLAAPVTGRKKLRAEAAMSTSLAFGGNNTALVFANVKKH